MMNFEEFKAWVKENITSKDWKETSQVEISVVKKNNGVSKAGLFIRESGQDVSPILYLDDYYIHYQNGELLDFVIYEMLLVTHINEKGYGRWILEAALMLTITVALSCIIHFKQKIECESFDNINKLYTKFFITMLMILIFSSFGILGFLIRDKVFAAKDCVILYWGFIQLLISFLIIRFIQFKSNIDRLKNLGFNIPIEKSLKEEKKSRDKTVRMIWIITIFCYLMLVLKVGFNYWIYSIGLTILVIDIFLLVMSRAEDNDDNDTENKAR